MNDIVSMPALSSVIAIRNRLGFMDFLQTFNVPMIVAPVGGGAVRASGMQTCDTTSLAGSAQLFGVLGIGQNEKIGQQHADAAFAGETKKGRIEPVAPTRREAD